MNNPENALGLLDPNATDPNAPRVHAPAAITKPLPAVIVDETKYYFLQVLSANMHNVDGKLIPFVNRVHASKLKHDQEYLDKEIEYGNIFLSRATEEQIHQYKMTLDPRGTMRAQLMQEMLNDPSVKEELERKIRQEMEARETGSQTLGGSTGIEGVDGKGTTAAERLAAIRSGSGALTPVGTSAVKDAMSGSGS